MCAISSLQLASCRRALVQNVFRFNTPLYIKWPPALPPVMLLALSRSREFPADLRSLIPAQERNLKPKKITVLVHAKLHDIPLRYFLQNLLVAAVENLAIKCLAVAVAVRHSLYLQCCCQPHDFKHLWIALLHLLIHSRERGITLRHRKVWCPCISSQVMQVVAINMFRYWLNERWYIDHSLL